MDVNMDERGLGVLRKLPREVRDIIYGFTAYALPDITTRPCLPFSDCDIDTAFKSLKRSALRRTSKQIFVEFIEVYLRERSFLGLFWDDTFYALERFLWFATTNIGPFLHTGSLGLHLETYNFAIDEDIGTAKSSYEKSRGDFANILQRLRYCHETFDIPAQKFFVECEYKDADDFLYDYITDSGFADYWEWTTVTNIHIKLWVSDREASVQALDRVVSQAAAEFNHMFRINTETKGPYYTVSAAFADVKKCLDMMKVHHLELIDLAAGIFEVQDGREGKGTQIEKAE